VTPGQLEPAMSDTSDTNAPDTPETGDGMCESDAGQRIQNAITYQLMRTVARINAQVSKRLRDNHQMSLAQWRILALLADQTCTTTAAIRRTVDIDKGQLSRLVSAMQTCGWIEVTEDPIDLRRQRLHLTPTGRRAHAAAEPMMRKRRELLESKLSPTEKKQLFAILAKINDAAEESLIDD